MKGFNMVKRVASTIVALAVIASTANAVPYLINVARGSGAYSSLTAVKNSNTGTNASVTITTKSNSAASMYYQIRKASGAEASEYAISTSTGTISLAYKQDGYGESMGRNGYEYKLRVAHRSQSTYSGTVTVIGSYTP